jgi:long-chain fatty acid transport protein
MNTYRTEVAILLLLSYGTALAGGLTTPGQGARAVSMAGAFTAVADDGSAVFYNPAGISQIDGNIIEAGANFLLPELRYTTTGGATEKSTKTALAPAFFITHRFNDRTSAGLGLYAPYARDAELKEDLANGFLFLRSKIIRTDFAAVISYQASDSLSIGGGLVIGYSQLDRSAPAGFGLRIKDKMDGVGTGGILGFLWRANDRVKVGFTYRTEMSIDHDGKRTLVTGGGEATSDARAKVRYPASLGLGVAFNPSRHLTLALDANWYGWSSMDRVTTRTDAWPDSTTPINASDSHDIRIGAEYRLAEGWALRAGYAYAEGVFPGTHIIPAQPDEDGQEFSLGLGKTTGAWRIDFAYQYAFTDEVSTMTNVFGYNGKYNIEQHLLGATATYRF